jgi:undecaprenyl-phosphate 4-deoxy-4-formamido-L-arabinose transferase
LCGIRAARGDVIVTLDDDLQHSPEDIPELVARLSEGFDVVYGCPAEPQHGSVRNHVTALTKLMLKKAMGIRMACEVSAFRAIRADVRDAFAHYRSPFVSIDVLLSWATTRFASLPIQHEPRRMGRSNYTVGKLVSYTMNLITGFTVLPLRLASVIGFVFTVFGFLVLAYVLGRYFVEGSSVPGFPFLASIVAIFSGAQLFAMGILGEYLARMHLRMMERPTYTVQQTVNLNGEVISYREGIGREMALPKLAATATLP